MENRNDSILKKVLGIIPHRVLSVFLLLILCNGAMATSPWLQITNDQFSIQVSQVSIKTVFDQIEAESDYVFFYPADLDLSQKVDIHIKKGSIKQTMDMLLRDTDLTYIVSGKEIYVKEKKAASAQVKTTKKTEPQKQSVSETKPLPKPERLKQEFKKKQAVAQASATSVKEDGQAKISVEVKVIERASSNDVIPPALVDDLQEAPKTQE